MVMNDAIKLFLATLDSGLTLDEAMGNLDLDAKAYKWPRIEVRTAACEIRRRYARGRNGR